jgi:D-alanyl-D-alanine carboxypeptidase/D-alanyl-D-alanine-endopeptidase (penicillin-binding protein 4)
VRGVAGYLLADSGRRYVVVAILNDARASEEAARAPIDALLQWASADALPAAASAH